jgi:hypothetical protein
VNAHGLDAAPVTERCIAPRRASLEHSHVAKREVVRDGIGGVESCEGPRDLFGRLPRGAAAPRESEVPGEPVDVHVDRDEEAPGRDVPHPEVDAIRGAHHPAKEKQQALAAARSPRIGQEVRRATAPAIPTKPAGRADRIAPGAQRGPQDVARASSASKRAPRDPFLRCTARAPARSRATSSPRNTRARHPPSRARRAFGSSAARAGCGPTRSSRSSSFARITLALPKAVHAATSATSSRSAGSS